jgi:hypothetical protein
MARVKTTLAQGFQARRQSVQRRARCRRQAQPQPTTAWPYGPRIALNQAREFVSASNGLSDIPNVFFREDYQRAAARSPIPVR